MDGKKNSTRKPNDRESRLKQALKLNMQRRKSQARARVSATVGETLAVDENNKPIEGQEKDG